MRTRDELTHNMTTIEKLLDCFINHDERLRKMEARLTHLENELTNCCNAELRTSAQIMWAEYEARYQRMEAREAALVDALMRKLLPSVRYEDPAFQ